VPAGVFGRSTGDGHSSDRPSVEDIEEHPGL
jgi:hypothetical protein